MEPTTASPERPERPRWKRILFGVLKSGVIGGALGALCALLPEHLAFAKVVCHLAAHILGGG